MKFLILLSFCFFFSQIFLHSQVKVITNNNFEFFGVIAEDTPDTLKLYTADKLQLIIPKKNVQYMEEIKCYIKQNQSETYYGRFSSFSEKGITMECEDGAIRQFDFKQSQLSFAEFNDNNYFFVGASLLTPGMFNINFGHYIADNYAVSFSFGYLYNKGLDGFQGNFLYIIGREKNFHHSIGLCAGYLFNDKSYMGRREWKYIGANYDFNYKGFFLQPGIGLSFNADNDLLPLLQVGYLHRFND